MAAASPTAGEQPQGLADQEERLVELVYEPANKAKKDGKGKVTARNCFHVPVTVSLVDYDGTRRISEKVAKVDATHEVVKVMRCGVMFAFVGTDGYVLLVRAQPANWERGDWYEEWVLRLARDTGRVSIESSRSWQAAQGHRRFESERLGVGVRYLLEDFAPQARAVTELQDPTFHQIAPCLAFGTCAMGKGLSCPRDGRPGCSIVDALPAAARGRATHFLSWAWGYSLSTFVHAIQEWVSQTEVDPKQTFLWVCFFCNNQFRILEEKSQEGSDNLEKAFGDRLTDIGKVVVLFDTWRSAFYLQRVWCVFETFMADKVGADLQIILPSSEARSMEAEIRGGGLGNVITAFRDVNVEKARATRELDERRVKDLIVRTSSFDRVNQVVKDRLVQWCKDRFSVMMEDEVGSPTPAAGRKEAAGFGAGGCAAQGASQADGGVQELQAETARLRAALAERDRELADVSAKNASLEAAAALDREELAKLREAVAALRSELAEAHAGRSAQSATSTRGPDAAAERQVASREGAMGEELESLMDSIVGEAGES